MIAAIVSAPLLIAATSIQLNVCPPTVPPPTISSPTAGTATSVTAFVRGTAMANSTVIVNDNGNQLATVQSDDAGSYALAVNLTAGTNTVSVQNIDACGTSNSSQVVVYVSLPVQTPPTTPTPSRPASKPPATVPTAQTQPEGQIPTPPATQLELHISMPPQSSVATTQSGLFIAGDTNMPATEEIQVNGQTMAQLVEPSTTFGSYVPLAVGDNTITVIVTAQGQHARMQFMARRIKPLAWYRASYAAWLILLAVILFICAILYDTIGLWLLRRT